MSRLRNIKQAVSYSQQPGSTFLDATVTAEDFVSGESVRVTISCPYNPDLLRELEAWLIDRLNQHE